MAKLYVTVNKDGTTTVRMLRLVGKELAAHKTVKGIKREDFRTKVEALVKEVAPPRRTPKEV